MRWSILPVSVGAHVVAGVLVWVIPLAAEVSLPVPAPLRALYLAAKVVPLPADVDRPIVQRADEAVPAPSFAPSEISREREPEPAATGGEAAPGPSTGGFPDATGGLPDGLGTALGAGPPSPPLVPAPAARHPLPIGGAIRAPKKILDVPPVYPEIAKSSGVEGLVILEAVISENGYVERVRVLRSQPLLDAAAIQAVKGWRYTPTLLNNVPVSVLITITVNFKLHE